MLSFYVLLLFFSLYCHAAKLPGPLLDDALSVSSLFSSLIYQNVQAEAETTSLPDHQLAKRDNTDPHDPPYDANTVEELLALLYYFTDGDGKNSAASPGSIFVAPDVANAANYRMWANRGEANADRVMPMNCSVPQTREIKFFADYSCHGPINTATTDYIDIGPTLLYPGFNPLVRRTDQKKCFRLDVNCVDDEEFGFNSSTLISEVGGSVTGGYTVYAKKELFEDVIQHYNNNFLACINDSTHGCTDDDKNNWPDKSKPLSALCNDNCGKTKPRCSWRSFEMMTLGDATIVGEKYVECWVKERSGILEFAPSSWRNFTEAIEAGKLLIPSAAG